MSHRGLHPGKKAPARCAGFTFAQGAVAGKGISTWGMKICKSTEKWNSCLFPRTAHSSQSPQCDWSNVKVKSYCGGGGVSLEEGGLCPWEWGREHITQALDFLSAGPWSCFHTASRKVFSYCRNKSCQLTNPKTLAERTPALKNELRRNMISFLSNCSLSQK